MKQWSRFMMILLVLVAMMVPVSGSVSAAPNVEEVIRGAFDARAKALFLDGSPAEINVSYDQAHVHGSKIVGASLIAYEHDKIREFQVYKAQRKVKVVSYKLDLTFQSVKINGDIANVTVIESLGYDWVYTHKPQAVNTSGMGMTHDVELARVGASWKIRRDDYIDSFRLGLEADHQTPRSDQASVAVPPATSTTPLQLAQVQIASTTVTYDRTKAATYADKYCGNYVGCGNSRQYNTAKYATNSANDCTNFVSQAQGDAAEGGGLPHDTRIDYNTYWYYDYPTTSGSKPWINADSFRQYLVNHPKGSTYTRGWLLGHGDYSHLMSPTSSYPNGIAWYMWKGDVMFYDWDKNGIANHTSIVTAYDSDGWPLVNTHSNDSYHVWWDLGRGDSANYWLVRMNNTVTGY